MSPNGNRPAPEPFLENMHRVFDLCCRLLEYQLVWQAKELPREPEPDLPPMTGFLECEAGETDVMANAIGISGITVVVGRVVANGGVGPSVGMFFWPLAIVVSSQILAGDLDTLRRLSTTRFSGN